jgi:hypothetical protein
MRDNEAVDVQAPEYESPRLMVVGNARDVVLGEAGGGWDYYSMTSPLFEFEADAGEQGLRS